MSGPFPPSGYPQQPAPGNQSGSYQPAGPARPNGPAPAGPPRPAGPASPGGQGGRGYGPPTQEFPTVQYNGLAGQHTNPGGNWTGPPPPRRRRGVRVLVAVLAALVIVGGVTTAILVLGHDHQSSASPGGFPVPASRVSSQQTGTPTPVETSDSATAGSAEGSTSLALTVGNCVTAVLQNKEYSVTKKVTCDTSTSDFVLAKTGPTLADCANHQYLLIQASTGIDCFTLDLKAGDCLDSNYLKVACAGAPFAVLSTEAGPGGSTSCLNETAATHWVPIGVNPVTVGCIGPPKS
ncbi:MAG TPA: hypothetical protein VHW44_05465 [Pseudonocardiaceae bacterium]|nr:hypothetical protein [Pseudonocardiaceae bacterium]